MSLLLRQLFLFVLGPAVCVSANNAQVPFKPLVKLNDTIIKYCPESNDSDRLNVSRVINQPLTPYLKEEIDILIWGNLTHPSLPRDSRVHYSVNATANTGDSGSLTGSFGLCDYLERMQQPPNASDPNPEKTCPPKEGEVLIGYTFWFWEMLVAPGWWSVKFDATTPAGERIWCLQAEFDLQCREGDEGVECLRDGGRVDLQGMLDRVAERG